MIRRRRYRPFSTADGTIPILAKVRLGTDPQAVKLDERMAARVKAFEERRVKAEGGPLTVERLVSLCLADLKLKPKTEREWRRLAAVEITPKRGALTDRLAAELSKAEVRAWSRAIVNRSHYTANRAFEVLRRAFSWGIGEDLLDRTPFLGLQKPGTEQQSERVLNPQEIRAIWAAL